MPRGDDDRRGRRRRSRAPRRDRRRWPRAARHGRRDAARPRPPTTAGAIRARAAVAHSAKGKASRSGCPVGKASGALVERRRSALASRSAVRARRDRAEVAAPSLAGGPASCAARRGQHLVRQVGRDGEAGAPPAPRRSPRRSSWSMASSTVPRAHVELARHQPRGGQALAGRQPPLEDGAPHLLADLPVQRQCGDAASRTRPSGAALRMGRGITGTVRISSNWLFRLYLNVDHGPVRNRPRSFCHEHPDHRARPDRPRTRPTPSASRRSTRSSVIPERAHYDRETVFAILDAALMCHIGYVIDGRPYVTPTHCSGARATGSTGTARRPAACCASKAAASRCV